MARSRWLLPLSIRHPATVLQSSVIFAVATVAAPRSRKANATDQQDYKRPLEAAARPLRDSMREGGQRQRPPRPLPPGSLDGPDGVSLPGAVPRRNQREAASVAGNQPAQDLPRRSRYNTARRLRLRGGGVINHARGVVRSTRCLLVTRFPVAQGDMHFGCRPERANSLFAFVQCAHALDLDGYRLLQRAANRAGLGCASGLAKDAVRALSRIQLDRLQQLLPCPVIPFSRDHPPRPSLFFRHRRHRVGQNIADGGFRPQSDSR